MRTLPNIAISATEFAEWCNWSGIWRAIIVMAKHHIIAHHKMAASSAPDSQSGAASTLYIYPVRCWELSTQELKNVI